MHADLRLATIGIRAAAEIERMERGAATSAMIFEHGGKWVVRAKEHAESFSGISRGKSVGGPTRSSKASAGVIAAASFQSLLTILIEDFTLVRIAENLKWKSIMNKSIK